MSRPLKTADNAFYFYCKSAGEKNVTYDGAAQLTDHWLPPSVFNALTGGELSSMLGTQKYATEEEAMSAVRRAERS